MYAARCCTTAYAKEEPVLVTVSTRSSLSGPYVWAISPRLNGVFTRGARFSPWSVLNIELDCSLDLPHRRTSKDVIPLSLCPCSRATGLAPLSGLIGRFLIATASKTPYWVTEPRLHLQFYTSAQTVCLRTSLRAQHQVCALVNFSK